LQRVLKRRSATVIKGKVSASAVSRGGGPLAATRCALLWTLPTLHSKSTGAALRMRLVTGMECVMIPKGSVNATQTTLGNHVKSKGLHPRLLPLSMNLALEMLELRITATATLGYGHALTGGV